MSKKGPFWLGCKIFCVTLSAKTEKEEISGQKYARVKNIFMSSPLEEILEINTDCLKSLLAPWL